MSIISAVREYLQSCPLFDDGKINIDYLSDKDGHEYSIDTSPAEEVVTQYMSGSAMCQYVFNVRSKSGYSQDTVQQIANSGFFEEFTKWIKTQNKRKALPKLEVGLTPLKVEALSTGYLSANFVNQTQYQIQCRLLYFRKGD